MEISLQDLASDGGLMYLNLVYKGPSTKSEIGNLQELYPGYEIIALVANQNGNVVLDINDIVHQELPAFQQQLGPQVNTQVRLSVGQVTKLKALGSKASSQISISVPAKVSYSNTQVLEQYTMGPETCLRFNASTLLDLIVSFSSFGKPEQIKYNETFASLKRQILAQCFSINEQRVQSFKDVMSLPIRRAENSQALIGKTIQKHEQSKSFILKPNITFEAL
jgi:hypothetical protein